MATKFIVNIESDTITLEAFGTKIKAEDSIRLEHDDWRLAIHSFCAYYEYFEYQMIIEILEEEGKILFSCKKIADDKEEYDFDDDDIDNFDDDFNDDDSDFDDEIENDCEYEYEKLEITKTLKISEDDYCVCFEKISEKKVCLCPH